MDFQRHTWSILPAADFSTAEPPEPGDLGVQLLAQVRASGRIADHMRLAIGGSKILEATFSSQLVFASPMIPAMTLVMQRRPRDINFRCNMTSSEWMDVTNLLRNRELIAGGQQEGNEEEDDNDDILILLENLVDLHQGQASIRWAVGVTSDRQLELILQALPASANNLNSKPMLKG
jgi:hypothetical protein